MKDSDFDFDLDPKDEALLSSIAQLDGKLFAMIELQAAILAHLTKDNATKLSATYKMKATKASHERVKEIRREMSKTYRKNFEESQKEDF